MFSSVGSSILLRELIDVHMRVFLALLRYVSITGYPSSWNWQRVSNGWFSRTLGPEHKQKELIDINHHISYHIVMKINLFFNQKCIEQIRCVRQVFSWNGLCLKKKMKQHAHIFLVNKVSSKIGKSWYFLSLAFWLG